MRFRIFILFFVSNLVLPSQNNKALLDSVYKLRSLSQELAFSNAERLKYAQIAREISLFLKSDTTILKSNRNLSSLYYELDLEEDYEIINKENLILAMKVSDSFAIADAHLNIASSYEFFRLNSDSAYYHYSKSLKFYDRVKNIEGSINCLMAIADIQDTGKDYIGSEENAIRAIKLIQNLPQTAVNLDKLWILNNLLGVTSQNLNRYDIALEYHDKAFLIAERMKSDNGNWNKTLSMNNQAGVYREQLEYEKALKLYNQLIDLRKEYQEFDPTFYPLIIDNLAYTKVLAGHKDNSEISRLFYKALDISDKLKDDVTSLSVSIDLAKYYKHLNKKDSSLKYAEKAYLISKKISSNDIFLESMVLLSELKEGEEGKKFLREHITLTDSLLQVERKVRNKYARIELETDELEAVNAQITRENLYLAILSIGLLVTAVLTYLFISQRAKNRKLKLMQVQQKANEDIYNLMLGQQDKVDEARAKEKTRISKELHDGVLGRLFGTRLSLDSLNFVDGKEAITNRAGYINELKTIEEDIRKISHELNTDFVAGSGFMDIVSELIETQTEAYGLTHQFNHTDDISWDLISNKVKINIYRIIQESMQNIYKHANAEALKISISLKNNVICLDITDDGDGFDTSKNRKGIGLKNMTSRVEDIEGTIEFASTVNTGTTVKVNIPYVKD